MNSTREQLIEDYHQQGYAYSEIVNLLSQRHGIIISLRQLKRILTVLNLDRRKRPESSLEEICTAILDELDGSGRCLGYKLLWRRLITTYGLNVKRDTVLKLLRVADPEGIAARSRKRLRRRKYIVPGPNFLWHVDGYDKLKPFGFAIHGCIDGYSRKVLWLEVATTNNKPEVIAYYYLKVVQKLRLVPTLLRSDKGTENSLIKCLQISFRMDHDDDLAGTKSFIEGTSTSNQRIESYWSQMRRLGGDFWISFFKDMRDNLIWNDSDQIQTECLRYCFGPLLKYDLEQIRKEWNRHSIRKQKNGELPTGKPNCLYYAPMESEDYKKDVSDTAINICLNRYAISPGLVDPKFEELIRIIQPSVVTPTNVDDALKLYISLLETIKKYENPEDD